MKLAAPQTGNHPFRSVLFDAIRWADANSDRSLQTDIGPSEIGVPCMRRLAYRLAGTAPVNQHSDPWFAIIGTAVHDWLAFALDQYQRVVLGRGRDNPRFLIEQRVDVDQRWCPGGKTDVYDLDLHAVVDYKIVGTTTMREVVRTGKPKQQYQVQAHTYGKGWRLRGLTPRQVVVVFLPRSDYLPKTYIWSAPYDESVADAALARVAAVDSIRRAIPIEQLPVTDDCVWCPFYRPHKPADTTGCPGHAGS